MSDYTHDCKHFTGVGDKACAAGVSYDSVRSQSMLPGCGINIPCIVFRRRSDVPYDPPSSPVRVTLSRRKGWRMPKNTVKVCRPSKYGNPFHVADVLDHYDGDKIAAQADCVRSYRRWITDNNSWCGDPYPPSLEEIRSELAGKNLACWCKEGTPCHADVLLDLANDQGHPARSK